MNNKTQLGLVFLVVMIIIAITTIALLKFQLSFKQAGAEKAEKETCRLSVLAATKLRLASFELLNNVECCQQNYVVKDQEEVVPTLANALYDCYNQFLKGEARLFSGQGRFCFVCSTIQFADGAAQGDIEGFYSYFFNQRAPRSRKTYAREIYGDGAESVRQQLIGINPNLFQLPMPKVNYTVMFVHDRGLAAKDLPVPHLAPSLQRRVGEFERVRTGAETAVAVLQRTSAEIPQPGFWESAARAVIIPYGVIRGAQDVYAGINIIREERRPEATTEYARSSFTLIPLEPADLNALGCTQRIRSCERV